MFYWIHQMALWLHISLGIVGLISFWLPMLSRKGSHLHQSSGRWFVRAMYTVSISGIVMCALVLTDPLAVRVPNQAISDEAAQRIIAQAQFQASFLLMLSVLVLTNVHFGVQLLKAKANRHLLRTKTNLSMLTGLLLLAIVIGLHGLKHQYWLLIIFSCISLMVAIGSFYYLFKPRLKHNEWIIAHMGNLIGAAIGAYTAFFAFGGRRLLDDMLTGQWQMVPWILPSVVGIIASQFLEKKYVRQFRVC